MKRFILTIIGLSLLMGLFITSFTFASHQPATGEFVEGLQNKSRGLTINQNRSMKRHHKKYHHKHKRKIRHKRHH